MSYYICIGINDMWTTAPEQAVMLANPEDGYKYTKSNTAKVDWKCPECNNIIKNLSINRVYMHGFSCGACSDGKSYPSKIMYNLLRELNIDFDTETKFSWCKFKMNNMDKSGFYDFTFLLNNVEYIVEMDGGFHFQKQHSKNSLTLEEAQFIDSEKDRLAKENNCKIIRINCKKSDLEYIKNNILDSELNDLFDLSEISWNIIHENSLKSLVVEACELWNIYHDTKIVADMLKLCRTTVRKYLRSGNLINLCEYKRIVHPKINKKNKSVICLNTGEIFDSINHAAEKFGILQGNISNCCRGARKSAGKRNGEFLKWMYYCDFLNKNKEEINFIFAGRFEKRNKYNNKHNSCKKVVCINTGEIFNSISDAEECYNAKHITDCCKNMRKTSGMHPETGEKLMWKYPDK